MSTSHGAALPAPAPGVLFQALEDGAVLFSPETEFYFGLNHVGARIWELLPPTTTTFAELCARLRSVYPDAAAGTIDADVSAILERLKAERLVTAAAVGE